MPQFISTLRAAAVFAVVAVAVGAVGGGGFADAAGAPGQTLRVREEVTSFAQVDVGTAGLSPGDEAIYRLRIDTLSGARIGVNNVVCTVLTPVSAGLAHCAGTARLPGGTIEFAGALRLQSVHSSFAVTGGTGDYRSAAGQSLVTWTNPPTDTQAIVTVELTG